MIWLTQIGEAFLLVIRWLEANPIMGAAVLAACAYAIQRYIDHARRAAAAVEIATRALEVMVARFNAAIIGKLAYELRGPRTAEMVEVMRSIDVGALPSGIVTSFANIRCDIAAINLRMNEVFAKPKNADPTKRVQERRADLESSCKVLAHALEQYEKLKLESWPYFVRKQQVNVPNTLAEFVSQHSWARSHR
jgi:ActR/RegA family two-component response regulator